MIRSTEKGHRKGLQIAVNPGCGGVWLLGFCMCVCVQCAGMFCFFFKDAYAYYASSCLKIVRNGRVQSNNGVPGIQQIHLNLHLHQ